MEQNNMEVEGTLLHQASADTVQQGCKHGIRECQLAQQCPLVHVKVCHMCAAAAGLWLCQKPEI